MVLAAVIASSAGVVAAPDLGVLDDELKVLLRSMRENFGATGRATMLGLLAELDGTTADSVRALIFTWGADLVAPVVSRARSRGEIGAGEVPVPVLALPFDLARHELSMRGLLPEERIDVIVDTITVPLLRLHSGVGAAT